MNGQERRVKIIQILQESGQPISGAELAKMAGVSRQVIVQDIALLRSEKYVIIPTTLGYMMVDSTNHRPQRHIKVTHSKAEIEKELNLIVDYGGKVLSVLVEHPIYGIISAELIIANRKDVEDFISKIKEQKGIPLLEISKGVHEHIIEANSEEELDIIEAELRREGF